MDNYFVRTQLSKAINGKTINIICSKHINKLTHYFPSFGKFISCVHNKC